MERIEKKRKRGGRGEKKKGGGREGLRLQPHAWRPFGSERDDGAVALETQAGPLVGGGEGQDQRFADGRAVGIGCRLRQRERVARGGLEGRGSSGVCGAICKGWRYDGVDLLTSSPHVSSAVSSFTIGAWFANSDLIDGGAVAFTGPNGSWNLSFQRTQGEPRADLDTDAGFITWLPTVLDNELHHFAWTLDAEADTARFFFDGIERSIWLRFTPNSNLGTVYSGEAINSQVGIAGPWAYNALDLSDGVVDEFRIFEGVRSPEWLLTEYRNQRDSAGFFTALGEEQAWPVAVSSSSTAAPFGRMRVSPNPFRAVANIELETDAFNVTVRVYDVAGRLVRTLRRPTSSGGGMMGFLWDGRDTAGTRVSNGIYYVRAQNGQAAVSSKVVLMR